jgi:hypothetical protein
MDFSTRQPNEDLEDAKVPVEAKEGEGEEEKVTVRLLQSMEKWRNLRSQNVVTRQGGVAHLLKIITCQSDQLEAFQLIHRLGKSL